MTAPQVRVVYDCVIFVQGIGRRGNAAHRCMELIEAGVVQLCLSASVIAEIDDVLYRTELLRKFPLLASAGSRLLLASVRQKALLLSKVPRAMALPRDPDDEPYTDLPVAADAAYLVTWNERHLTYLMRQDTPEGIEFCRRFPSLKIVDPPTFLRAVNAPAGAQP